MGTALFTLLIVAKASNMLLYTLEQQSMLTTLFQDKRRQYGMRGLNIRAVGQYLPRITYIKGATQSKV